ncbi:MAG: DNA internalization-related competence protein ComEC/Rec2 [Gammaproteobacteria bacterium]|nr:DNA internalization-related competence protein ComEC/Rec2 [Gammaproteobacteria bacterium]
MIRACLVLLAGLYAAQLNSFVVDSDLIRPVFVLSFLLLLVPRWRLPGWCLLGGCLFLNAALSVLDQRIDADLVGDSIVARVHIRDFPRQSGRAVAFIAEAADDRRLPRRMRISWLEPPVSLRPGDNWQLELRLRRPRGTSNPGVFDVEQWLFRDAIGAVGYVVAGHRNHLLDSGSMSAVLAVRQHFVERTAALVPSASQAAVLAALVVGVRNRLSRDDWDRYARTGTSHLIAISGLHIGLAAGGSYMLVACLGGLLRYAGNLHRLAILVSLLVSILYALVSGCAVPARRASTMIVIAGIVLLRRGQPNAAVIVAVTCIGMAVTAPLATMAPGFKLSFAAVAVLLWLARQYPGAGAARGYGPLKLLTASRQLGMTQVLLFLGLLPATVLLFDRIAFTAPLVNLLAVPVFSFVTVPFALLGLLLDGPLQFVGDQVLLIAARSIGLIEAVITFAAALDVAAHAVPELAGIAVLIVLLPVIWVVAPPGWPGRNLAWLALVALVLYSPRKPPPGCARIDVLDVGQGLAALVQTHRSVLLFDTGPAFQSGGSAAASIIVPLLASRGIERVDSLVVSHTDLDHAGGVAEIVRAVDVGEVISGETLMVSELAYRRCSGGSRWHRDGVEFRLLHPPPGSAYKGNDASCVLQVAAGQRRLLLTGDIERRVEEELVRSAALHTVDAVVVPHHGSGTSSGAPFVRALSPKVAIVPAGFGNRWGFPKPAVAERWRAVGADVLTTGTSGAVSVFMCAGADHVTVRKHRQEQRRIWHE